ncbi:alpha/beta fold hydrolase [Kutzneria sp. NPDC052558]|uniref:alpha/beta fold hydrolase n=1 Tax=Kutzneria sp. NPDC052558 TaxID=3364121 RepID=UPI0037C7A4AB
MTDTAVQPENEFAQVPATAADVGVSPPPVSRRWVNITAGGHVSGVTWGSGSPEIVLLHRSGGDARTLDRVALLLDRPALVIDLPGAGRSSGPASTPRRAARDVAEAVASFAPRANVVVGVGDGGLVAIAVAARRSQLDTVVLVDTAPGSEPDVVRDHHWRLSAGITLIHTTEGPLTASDLADLRLLLPSIAVVGIDTPGLIETEGAGRLAAALRRIKKGVVA